MDDIPEQQDSLENEPIYIGKYGVRKAELSLLDVGGWMYIEQSKRSSYKKAADVLGMKIEITTQPDGRLVLWRRK